MCCTVRDAIYPHSNYRKVVSTENKKSTTVVYTVSVTTTEEHGLQGNVDKFVPRVNDLSEDDRRLLEGIKLKADG